MSNVVPIFSEGFALSYLLTKLPRHPRSASFKPIHRRPHLSVWYGEEAELTRLSDISASGQYVLLHSPRPASPSP